MHLISNIGQRIGVLCRSVLSATSDKEDQQNNRKTNQNVARLLKQAQARIAELEQKANVLFQTDARRDLETENIQAIALISATLIKNMNSHETAGDDKDGDGYADTDEDDDGGTASNVDGRTSPGGSKLSDAAALVQMLFGKYSKRRCEQM